MIVLLSLAAVEGTAVAGMQFGHSINADVAGAHP
jgi:hypothetical protein